MISLVNDTIDRNDINKLIEWLSTHPRLTKGPVTLEYEKKWAEWLGTKYSVFVNSGSSANLLMLYALIAANKLKNNKVVIPGLCWATDLSPVFQFNLEPILCDINLDTLSVNLTELEEIFKKESPSVLILVSILGFAPDTLKVKELCEKYDVILLEDNCESLGTEIDKVKLGNFGIMASYSSYFGHHISTIEGGIVATNDEDLYNILLSIRSHGWDRDLTPDAQKKLREKYNISDFNALYTFYYDGFNVRSTDLQAFIGLGQLEKLDGICKKRSENFDYLQKNIKNDFWKPKPIDRTFTSNFCYPIIHPKRDELVRALKEKEVEVRPLVCGSMGNQPFYTQRYGKKELINCNTVDSFGLYIPNNPGLTAEDLDLMINIINNIIN
jgi:CDP-6-deoxy-D-xylo-4-hexulose-3-dehydrase